ncbi:MAG: UDP-N-acetylmuramate dehydrogenase [Desulfotalea sp.]
MNEKQRMDIAELVSNNIEFDQSLAPYTSFGIGGVAKAVVTVHRAENLKNLLSYLDKQKIEWRVIGRGSNLLVKDAGFAGVIILLAGDFKSVTEIKTSKDESIISFGAGLSLTAICNYAADNGLAGCEFLYGIPGSLGGAVAMNAGAWNGEVSNIIDSVTLYHDGEIHHLFKEELSFSYRSFNDLHGRYASAIILSTNFLLKKSSTQQIKSELQGILAKRKAAQKVTKPNAGSFFKNPAGYHAGRLIQECELKGRRVGDAMVSLEHANFLVNIGNAKGDEMLSLMKIIQSEVLQKTGVQLVPEVHFI